MTTHCTRCGRITLRPEYIAGRAYGTVCAVRLGYVPPKPPARAWKGSKRRARAADKAGQAQRDEMTRDLFEEEHV